jgi:hypothetical protein
MKFLYAFIALFSASLLSAQDTKNTQVAVASIEENTEPVLIAQGESHLKNLKQLTFGGDNAEAYFSFDGKKLSFQSNNPLWNLKCDQIYYMIINEAEDNKIYQPMPVSNGEGRTTCAFYMPSEKKNSTASKKYYMHQLLKVEKNVLLRHQEPQENIFGQSILPTIFLSEMKKEKC